MDVEVEDIFLEAAVDDLSDVRAERRMAAIGSFGRSVESVFDERVRRRLAVGAKNDLAESGRGAGQKESGAGESRAE